MENHVEHKSQYDELRDCLVDKWGSPIVAALTYARSAHQGQTRNDGVTPYIIHPMRVALACTFLTDAKVALLHDVIEDCGKTYADIEEAFGPVVAMAVGALSRDKTTTSYVRYLRFLVLNGSARRVKILDILDNLGDGPSRRSTKKYSAALMFLLYGLDDPLKEIYPDDNV